MLHLKLSVLKFFYSIMHVSFITFCPSLRSTFAPTRCEVDAHIENLIYVYDTCSSQRPVKWNSGSGKVSFIGGRDVLLCNESIARSLIQTSVGWCWCSRSLNSNTKVSRRTENAKGRLLLLLLRLSMPFRDSTRVMMTDHAFGLGKCLDLEPTLQQQQLLLMNGCFLCAAVTFFAAGVYTEGTESQNAPHERLLRCGGKIELRYTVLGCKSGKRFAASSSTPGPGVHISCAVTRNFLAGGF